MKLFLSSFFKQKMLLEQEVEAYLNCVNEVCGAFNLGVKSYLKGDQETFSKCATATSQGEKKADEILKNIKYHLYANTLYPDYQKDITLIFDQMDDVADISNQVLIQLSLETPYIPDQVKELFQELVDYTCKTSGELVNGARHLFKNRVMIEDHANKVYFYENEANRVLERILTSVHQGDYLTELAYKRHVALFAMKILAVSEQAYKVAKRLVFYLIKSDADNYFQ
jgi:uncharacterized protein